MMAQCVSCGAEIPDEGDSMICKDCQDYAATGFTQTSNDAQRMCSSMNDCACCPIEHIYHKSCLVTILANRPAAIKAIEKWCKEHPEANHA